MLAKGIGAEVDPMIAVADDDGPHLLDALSIFMEDGGVLVTCCPESEEKITAIAQSADLACLRIGVTGGQDLRIVAINGKSFVNVGLNDLRAAYSGVLESQLASEVVTG